MDEKKKIRALIVDDERLARKRLRTLLAEDRDVEIVGECADGAEAVMAIERDAPDLLFLDVQMPELDGFAVLEAVGPDKMPSVVFVTAYDRYALRAFEVHALDYLLKPFDEERFQNALQRAKEQLRSESAGALEQRLMALLETFKAGQTHVDRLLVKASGRVLFLKTDEIDWIEASGNYVRLHVGRESYLFRETMNAMEAKLDPAKFLRIHRSTLVNSDRIKEMQPWFSGEHVILLRDGTELRLSRGYRERFEERLKSTL